MSAQAKRLGRELAKAWQHEHVQILGQDGMLGERTSAIVDEALDVGCLEEAWAHARPLLRDYDQAWITVNREAERRAGLTMWDPEHVGRDDAQAMLLAIPCTGQVGQLESWMKRADQAQALADLCQAQVALLTGVDTPEIEHMGLLAVPVSPAAVARLTATARRALMMELLGPGTGRVMNALSGQPASASADAGPGLGMLVLAAVVRDGWGQRDERDPMASCRVLELALGLGDEDLLAQANVRWQQAMDALRGAGHMAPIHLGQPMSVNEALLHSLHSRLLGMRLAPGEDLSEAMDPQDFLVLEHVRSLTVGAQPDGSVNVLAEMNDGQRSVQVPGHWAFVEGEQAFQEVLLQAMGMDLDQLDREDNPPVLEVSGQDPQDPRQASGDHPAWAQALPAPPRVH